MVILGRKLWCHGRRGVGHLWGSLILTKNGFKSASLLVQRKTLHTWLVGPIPKIWFDLCIYIYPPFLQLALQFGKPHKNDGLFTVWNHQFLESIQGTFILGTRKSQLMVLKNGVSIGISWCVYIYIMICKNTVYNVNIRYCKTSPSLIYVWPGHSRRPVWVDPRMPGGGSQHVAVLKADLWTGLETKDLKTGGTGVSSDF